MIKPSLVILAAGMGSRYGGLKQLDGFGPNNETIIDYSLYDAIIAGFEKIVFIIKDSFRDEFAAQFSKKLEGKIDFAFVSQELDKLPQGCTLPDDRVKPWGTAHAVAVAREEVSGPFGVINADDFYGREAYITLCNYLKGFQNANQFCIVAYSLLNTLSEHGTVNRGICKSDFDGFLVDIEEVLKIKKDDEGSIIYPTENGSFNTLPTNSIVSMNMFGLFPSYFDYFDQYFKSSLEKFSNLPEFEYYIPTFLDELIKDALISVKVLETDEEWFGVTYKEDKPIVQQNIKELLRSGRYPSNLWN